MGERVYPCGGPAATDGALQRRWVYWRPPFWWSASSLPKPRTRSIGPATKGENSPSEIPAKGWKGVLLRVYADIGDHRILALAAGMTYYSILAIFRRSPPSFPFTAFFRILARSPNIWTSYPASCRAGPLM